MAVPQFQVSGEFVLSGFGFQFGVKFRLLLIGKREASASCSGPIMIQFFSSWAVSAFALSACGAASSGQAFPSAGFRCRRYPCGPLLQLAFDPFKVNHDLLPSHCDFR